ADDGGAEPGMIVVCGGYEGVDDRVRQLIGNREISIGDYVLSGGELPAMVLIDAVARLVPGVLGDEASLAQDAFAEGAGGGYPQFTRPAQWRGVKVPPGPLSRHPPPNQRPPTAPARARRPNPGGGASPLQRLS